MQDLAMSDIGDPTGRSMVEGSARVVALDGDRIWLEIEGSAGCGACAAKAGCGVAGKARGPSARQRFALPRHFEARIGDRIVVGVPESALVRASAIAYAVPVATMVAAAVIAGALGAGDGGAALSAAGGLAAGLGFSQIRARRMAASGRLSPVYIRHARDGALGGGCAFTPS